MKRRLTKTILILGITCSAFILLMLLPLSSSNDGKQKDDGGALFETKEEQQVEYTTIETPYVTLELSDEMKECIKIEVQEETTGIVSFWGTLNGKEMHLCDLFFGREEGEDLGYLVAEEGAEPTRVNIKYYDDEIADLTVDEIIEVQRMQQEVEHAIDKLVETGELKLAE